jgi:predicted unusual protein kinase regulating ubiquinone biosynthesis (AarF/ABC1/UbiB family)
MYCLGLAREMNTNLPLELNFNQEAENIAKCGKLLAPLIQTGELALPTVHSSTERVLVMSFEEGWYITDAAKMEASGVDGAEVAHLISKTFCEQM